MKFVIAALLGLANAGSLSSCGCPQVVACGAPRDLGCGNGSAYGLGGGLNALLPG